MKKLTKEQKEARALKAKQQKEAAALEQSKRDSFLAITKKEIEFHMEQLADVNSRLDFLTDIFNLTEDLRHEISWATENLELEFGSNISESDADGTEVSGDEAEDLRNQDESNANDLCDREESGSECVVSEQPVSAKTDLTEYLKTFTLVAFNKEDPKKKVLYKYITKHRVKFIDAETGEKDEKHQYSFFKIYTAQKKTNRSNKKRRFMNFGRKRVA